MIWCGGLYWAYISPTAPAQLMSELRRKVQSFTLTFRESVIEARSRVPEMMSMAEQRKRLVDVKRAFDALPANTSDQGACHYVPRLSDNVKTYEIASACGAGIEIEVWEHLPRRTVRTEFVAPGGDVLPETPHFEASPTSTAACSAATKTCVFEGVVFYRHSRSNKPRILRLAVLN